MPKTKVPAVISTFCLCFLFWVLLTWSFTPQEMIAGAVVSLAAALFTSGFFIHENAFRLANPVRFGALVAYVFIFLGELIKANLDVARRCFGGCKEVNPGIVKVPVELEGDYAQAMLANSITLTPGTITLDIAEQDGKTWYYIHWIDVAETDREKAGKIIKGRLENGIRRIWQ
ncbi:MAG: Na+/H+ antiporter subunit E [Oscillospiraceae bacterium]|nr:Na+/H+ antiporter subunit E [Oscillospiraceae bacterium]